MGITDRIRHPDKKDLPAAKVHGGEKTDGAASVSGKPSYKKYLFIGILLVFVAVTIVFDFAIYQYSSSMQKQMVDDSIQYTIDRIADTANLVDIGLTNYDKSLDAKIKPMFLPYLEEYQNAGGKVSRMNLQKVVSELKAANPDVDVALYIIDKDYIISGSTDPNSLGLDFKNQRQYYVDALDKICAGDDSELVTDRCFMDTGKNVLFKYGYMLAPDRNNILQIGLTSDKYILDRDKLSYTAVIKDYTADSNYIVNVNIYDINYKNVATGMTATPEFRAMMDRVVDEGHISVMSGDGNIHRYIYLPLENSEFGTQTGMIFEIESSYESLYESQFTLLLLLTMMSLILFIFVTFASMYITRLVTDKLDEFALDAKMISDGDLSHSIRDLEFLEFDPLINSINRMLDTLRATIRDKDVARLKAATEKETAEAIYNFAEIVIIITDESGRILMANKKASESMKYSVRECIGRQITDFFAPDDHQFDVIYHNACGENRLRVIGTEEVIHKIKLSTGEIRPFAFSRIHTTLPDGGKVWIITGRDLTDELRQKKILEDAAYEKGILLGEIHHRVKNNLQIISSIIGLKIAVADNEDLQSYLQQIKLKISAISRVHEMLYDNEEFTDLAADVYTPDLVNEIVWEADPDSLCRPSTLFDIDEDIRLTLDGAVHFGLMLTEIISNSVLHGLKGRENGVISLSLKKDSVSPYEYILTVSDNGCGLPEDYQLKMESGVGLNLVASIAAQLDGSIEYSNKGINGGEGTTVSVKFRDYYKSTGTAGCVSDEDLKL